MADPAPRNAQLEAGRRRRLLAQLDRELARRGHKPPPKAPPRQATRTVLARARARQEHEGALRSYEELRRAVQAEGGISPNRDYHASEIPRELRARKGRGLAPDEMASVLGTHGRHYDGDVEMFTDIERRRERVRETHEAGGGSEAVCSDACRDDRGMFERCAAAASRVQRICRRMWRDASGRFKPAPH